MADNYLERQRELYEARKAAWEKAKKLGKRKQNQPSNLSKPTVSPDMPFRPKHTAFESK